MSRRTGFTLLEIVLALAILAGALAALGEVMRLADRNAEMTRSETQAQMLAESVMEQLLAGARPLSSVTSAVFDLVTEPRWEYSIAIEPTQRRELLLVRVAVAEQIAPELQPARFELVRWMLNPDYLPAASSSSTSDSGGGSSSAFGDSGGASEGVESP
jgi:type II secretion system protein I